MRRQVVVIGGGAAGVTAAARLLVHPVDVVLVEATARIGGVAYSTPCEHHLLNVPAGRMGADVRDPDGFVRWLRREGPAEPGDFVARARFGRYLEDHLRTAGLAGPGTLTRVRGRAVEITARAVRLASGRSIRADAAVLAVGTFAPGTAWAPTELLDFPGFVTDPWAPDALNAIPPGQDVLLVGTGLTMVDLALRLAAPGRVVHAVSRHGLLPRRHRPSAPAPAWRPTASAELDALRTELTHHLRTSLRRQRDWRAAFDSFRPVTAELWARLSEADKAAFLELDVRGWDVRRHRMSPQVADQLTRLRRAGLLRVRRGELTGFDGDVRLSDGSALRVGAVVNCTGAQGDLRLTGDPLARSLFETGSARPGPLGLGFDTAPDGALPTNGIPLWTLGAPRRGNLWETTAFPEIRAQASVLAESVARLFAAQNRPYAVKELAS